MRSPNPPRCILLDLDGTLLDTAPDLHFALNHALGEAGHYPVPLEPTRPWVSHGAPGMVGFALGRNHPSFDTVLERMIHHYGNNLAVRTTLFKGMSAVLEKIESAGLPWGVVTNKRSRFSEPLLRSLGLFDRTACVISGDSTKNKKPHPEPLFEACRKTRFRPAECLYVGDAAKDIQAGKSAGITTLAAAYGYIDPEDDVNGWGASGILNAPLDLLAWIDG